MNDRTRYISLPEKLGRGAVVALWIVFYLALYGCGSQGGDERTTAQAQKSRVQVRTAVAHSAPMSPPVLDEPTPVDEDPLKSPEISGVTFEGAHAAFESKRYDEAEQLFERYVQEHPGNPWGHYMLGLSYWKAGSLEPAELAFERALERDPAHIKSLLNLSRVLLDDGRPEAALEQIDAALDIDEQSNDGLRLLGRALYAVGDVDGAIDAYQEAIAVDESDAWAMNNLGLILIREEQFDDALLPLARATQIKTDAAVFFNNLGIALERTGHFRAAAEAYARAVSIEEGSDKARVSLARVEGREEDPFMVPVDLGVLAERFVADMARWRTERVTVTSPDREVVETEPVSGPVIQPGVPDSVPVDSTVPKPVTTGAVKQPGGNR